jgi:hypothetical protein
VALTVGAITAIVATWLTLEPFWLIVAIGAAVGALFGFVLGRSSTLGPYCTRCQNWKQSRPIGSIQRDAQAAKEALEAGDLAALGALSPEGDTIDLLVNYCPRCAKDATIDVSFWPKAGGLPLAHVTYPGGALPIFERLCAADGREP